MKYAIFLSPSHHLVRPTYKESPLDTTFPTKDCGLVISIHELQNAPKIVFVWSNFGDFISHHIQASEVGILNTYNGEICDHRWLWQLTQAPLTTLSTPSLLKFLMDPLHII